VVFLVDFVHVGGGHCRRREVFGLVWLFVFEVVDGGDQDLLRCFELGLFVCDFFDGLFQLDILRPKLLQNLL